MTKYTYGYVPTIDGEPTDAYIHGTWDDVRRAYRRGSLTDEQFSALWDERE